MTSKKYTMEKWFDTIDKNSTMYHVVNIFRSIVSSSDTVVFFGGCIRDIILGIEPTDYDIEVMGNDVNLAKGAIKRIVSKLKSNEELNCKCDFDESEILNSKYICFTLEITIPNINKTVKIDLVVKDILKKIVGDFTVNILSMSLDGNLSVINKLQSIEKTIEQIKNKQLQSIFGNKLCDKIPNDSSLIRVINGHDYDDYYDYYNYDSYELGKYTRKFLLTSGKYLERLNKMISKGFKPIKSHSYVVEKKCNLCHKKICNEDDDIILRSLCNHTFCLKCITTHFKLNTLNRSQEILKNRINELNNMSILLLKRGDDFNDIMKKWDNKYKNIIAKHSKKQKNCLFSDVDCPCCKKAQTIVLYSTIY
ncbi:putative CAA-nucleotidyltransferase [Bodo saltans virus]|uniref:CAA-nucleotidyltransferase n=1 Tax=Bodo saltans virus TaxID=2024608 RepID=A0A2H4UTI8_9VIRU|nr:putative CAA-nucleotidyltransferase [Bodo saltans virus]ATZ80251.1 putative CAA-nucleotidyltransferase [Bodo saltans virus]